jgi:hypothetical protein
MAGILEIIYLITFFIIPWAIGVTAIVMAVWDAYWNNLWGFKKECPLCKIVKIIRL